MVVARSRVSLDQFLKLPEEKPALEFEDGLIAQKVSPQGKHSRLQLEFAKRLDDAGQQGSHALAFTELRVTFRAVSRVPDVSVYRRHRVPLDPSGQVANDFREPPDIVVEMVSPEQSVNALVRRCLWCVRNGVEIALLVDPADESVLVFRENQVPSEWRGTDRIDVSDVLPKFELTVEELFSSLRVP